MSPHQPDTEDDRSDFRTRCDGGGRGGGERGEVWVVMSVAFGGG
jgi:hypothetical protein